MRTGHVVGLSAVIAVLCGASCGGGADIVDGSSGASPDGEGGLGGDGADGSSGSGGASSGGDSGESGGASSGGTASGGAGSGGLGGAVNEACGWTYTVGGYLEDQAHSVLALADGSVVVVGVTGSTDSALGEGTGAFALRLSETGDLLWSQVYPGVGDQLFIAQGHSGQLVIAGTARSTDACDEHHGADDAWVAEISPDDGELGAHACIGGDDDEIVGGVRARGAGVSAHYLVTGSVDSHESGNIGPNHNAGGGFDSPDVLLGFWTPSTGSASGMCFGSQGPEFGSGFVDGDRILAGTSGDGTGDFSGQESLGFGDIAIVSLSSSDACTEAPCATAVRLGGSANESVLDGDGNLLIGTTASTDGTVGCPGASQTTQRLWLGSYSAGDIALLTCLSTGDTISNSDLTRGAGIAAAVGLVFSPTSGDFEGAVVEGTLASSSGAYLLAWDEGNISGEPEIVVLGDRARLDGVAVREDGCVVAVGNRPAPTFGDVLVYTRPMSP
jgi:hypothetical protein